MDNNEIYELLLNNTVYEILNADYIFTQVFEQKKQALTLRNWVIGYFVDMYEQTLQRKYLFNDRKNILLATQLHAEGLIYLNVEKLSIYKQLFLRYPQFVQLLPVNCPIEAIQWQENHISPLAHILLNELSFEHLVVLSTIKTPIKRAFYEIEIIKNNWTVDELQWGISHFIFEQTGLEIDDKEALLQSYIHKIHYDEADFS